jgi:hypothetical protein
MTENSPRKAEILWKMIRLALRERLLANGWVCKVPNGSANFGFHG